MAPLKIAFPISALIIILALSYLFMQSRSPNYDRYAEIIQATYRIEAIDATLNRDILLIRAGLLNHYDSVTQAIIDLSNEFKVVVSLIESGKILESNDISYLLKKFSSDLEKKEALLDQFKTNQAVLQNSYNFLLLNHNKIIEKIANSTLTYESIFEYLRISNIFPKFIETPTPRLRDDLQSYLTNISNIKSDKLITDAIILHSGSILQRASPVHDIVVTMLAMPLKFPLQNLRIKLAYSHSQSQSFANTNRNLLYGFSIILLVFLCYLFFRLQRISSNMESSNLLLKDEIKERQKVEDALSLERKRLRTVLNNIPSLLWAIDRNSIFLLVEGKSLPSIGLSSAELVGKKLFDIYPENTPMAQHMTRALLGETSNRSIHFNQSIFECHFTPILNRNQVIVGAIGVAIDITERYRAENQLQLSAKVFDNTTEGIVVMDSNKNIVTVNRAFCEMCGYSSSEIVGRDFLSLNSKVHDAVFYQNLWQSVTKHNQWKGEVWARRKNGKLYPQLFNICAVLAEDKSILHYIVIISDITRLIATQRRLEHLASYDLLTDLPNRSFFYNRLNHCYVKSQRSHLGFAIMFVDIDDFKKVNDNLGHEVGDELLKTIAVRLKKCVRQQDTIARMGGDEFTILLEQIAETSEVAVMAQRLIQEMSFPFYTGNHEIFTSVSVGICLYPADGADVPTLIKNADTAMYKAKEQGKNTFVFFTETMNTEINKRFSIEFGLRRALERGELILCYQPQLNLNNNRIVGIEALVRWQHPDKGLLCPDFFLPVAEETGLISALGEWVLETAFRQIKHWNDEGLTSCRVSVNISARQFIYKDLISTISRILEKIDVPANLIALDIKESTIMHNPDYTQKILASLNELNIEVSIDDFGTGYSSLSNLRHFPLGKLKMDRSFIEDITHSPDNAAIASAIISMAHNLNMTVSAEGVETGEQIEFLKAHQCDFVQGYYVSEPLEVDKMTIFLKNQGRHAYIAH